MMMMTIIIIIIIIITATPANLVLTFVFNHHDLYYQGYNNK